MTQLPPAVPKDGPLPERFRCDRRRRAVSLEFCVDSYRDINALHIKDAPCWRCKLGEEIRRRFSET